MNCYKCGGQTSRGVTTSTLEREGTLLIVREVPAEVCACGEAIVTPDTADRLRELLDAAVREHMVTAVQEFHQAEAQPS